MGAGLVAVWVLSVLAAGAVLSVDHWPGAARQWGDRLRGAVTVRLVRTARSAAPSQRSW